MLRMARSRELVGNAIGDAITQTPAPKRPATVDSTFLVAVVFLLCGSGKNMNVTGSGF
jgi:hypothetical protein